jgi:syringate O-demethylase
MAGKTHRKKVTLVLNDDDVRRVIGSMFQERNRFKYIDFPSAVYAMHPYDKVLVNGKPAGLSTWIGYSSNEGKMLTLAIVNAEHSTPGTQVSLVWGEEGGGSAKPTVERHVQTEIRAEVATVPYSKAARESYAEGWRTKALAG